MAGGAGGDYGWGREVRHRSEFFYVDDGMVALVGPVWLQGLVDTLIGFFGSVGIQTDVWGAVGVIYCPCRVAGTQSEVCY